MRYFILLLICSWSFCLCAQNDFVVIDSIKIAGHNKTRGPIIFRELVFQAGDTIPLETLQSSFAKSKQNLLNTQLFNLAEINITEWTERNHIDIDVNVIESWYFFPAPIFELADRNFNVWWFDQNRAINRINLGFRLKYLNMTGHRDELNLTFHAGYTEKYELDYSFPYINSKKTFGLRGNILFSRNKEINYDNLLNKQLFYREDDLDLFKRFRVRLGAIYRPSFNFTHFFTYEYHENQVDPIVIEELNPNYFDGGTFQRFHALEYNFEAEQRDLRLYPLKGYFFRFKARKIGLFRSDDQQILTLNLLYQKTFPILKKSAVTNQTILQTSLSREQIAFNLFKAHGYGDDYLRGYELYVINGESFFLNKTKGKWHILSRTVDWKKWMPIKALKIMPASLYFSTNIDFGYVGNKNAINELNPLANNWLSGLGIGLDLVLYNNYVYTVELSRNQLGETGIFLHFNVGL